MVLMGLIEFCLLSYLLNLPLPLPFVRKSNSNHRIVVA